MSDYELNKGKLIPFNLTEDIAEQLVRTKGEDLEYDSYLEQVEDDLSYYSEGLYKVNGKYYTVHFEIRGGELDYIAEAVENEDGTIDFHTYHYNGGAHWTEVVEGALNGKR